MRGAPQVGFSETIRKIKARTSLLTRFRPPTWLTLETHVQYKRNPDRCQFTTVRGVTKTRGFLHPHQNFLNATQNSLCRAVNRRRGCCACRASNCRRRARFSRTRSSRERKTLTNQPRKCRSDTIMARILAEKSESGFSPSHSFCTCTTFWRGTTGNGFSRGREPIALIEGTSFTRVRRPVRLLETHGRELRGQVAGTASLGSGVNQTIFCRRRRTTILRPAVHKMPLSIARAS